MRPHRAPGDVQAALEVHILAALALAEGIHRADNESFQRQQRSHALIVRMRLSLRIVPTRPDDAGEQRIGAFRHIDQARHKVPRPRLEEDFLDSVPAPTDDADGLRPKRCAFRESAVSGDEPFAGASRPAPEFRYRLDAPDALLPGTAFGHFQIPKKGVQVFPGRYVPPTRCCLRHLIPSVRVLVEESRCFVIVIVIVIVITIASHTEYDYDQDYDCAGRYLFPQRELPKLPALSR